MRVWMAAVKSGAYPPARVTPVGAPHVGWYGSDPVVRSSPCEIAWLAVQVPKTDYLVTKIKITLDLTRRPDWKQIDAVQPVAAP